MAIVIGLVNLHSDIEFAGLTEKIPPCFFFFCSKSNPPFVVFPADKSLKWKSRSRFWGRFLSASSSLYEVPCKIMVKFHKVIDSTVHILYNFPWLYRITKLFVYFY